MTEIFELETEIEDALATAKKNSELNRTLTIAAEIIAERRATHGDLRDVASYTITCYEAAVNAANSSGKPLGHTEKFCLFMDALKTGRFISGDRSHEDHLADKVGYTVMLADAARIKRVKD